MNSDLPKRSHWLAGELAQATGVSSDTLRHYERKGVLKCPPRAKNGYRKYPEYALKRVLLIRRALSFGFTLDELARILNERDKGGAPCREVCRLVAAKLENVEEQIQSLINLRDEFKATLTDWDKRLSSVNFGEPVNLLETLAANSTHDIQTILPKTNHGKSIAIKSKFRKKENKNEIN